MAPVIEHAVVAGTFSLDGGTWDVENNVWVIGDGEECVVIDAPHAPGPIGEMVGGRHVRAVLCTHAHDDHVGAAVAFADRYGAPVRLHPGDAMLWSRVHGDRMFTPLADGESLAVAGVELQVLHTPGHSPGSVCFWLPALGTLFSGDTLFHGGPGATGRSFSDFATIIASIRERLLTLPADTVVRTGHGPQTSVGAEAPHLDEWIARGH
ncbi:MAG: MBL fold metallo-hydrolase [Jatrophihabitans sp.]|nr:MAG: MBL fold metallo-hydrolase [Jatrophihabitans sp.]